MDLKGLSKDEAIKALKILTDRKTRISTLYSIKDKEGKKIPFRPNWAQLDALFDPHPKKLILKARQLGMTTGFCIDALDKALFEVDKGFSAGIIAHTLDDAQDIFTDKLKYSFEHVPAFLRPYFQLVGDSAKELAFRHGSVIRVGTSLRSSTNQHLHITEFGKICAKYPERAREIISGSLETVQVGQNIIIESTAEGKEGYFFDMVQKAIANEKAGKTLGVMDWKFFFFPWWKEPLYRIKEEIDIPKDMEEYFEMLEALNIHLEDDQKRWYTKKYETLGDDMLREYPSTPSEAFQASQDAYFYAEQMKDINKEGRLTAVPYDRNLPVHTAWDLGQADNQVIWFFQISRTGAINVFDYLQKRNCDLPTTFQILTAKNYTYGTHIWPHDANHRDKAGITFKSQAAEFGLFGIVLENHGIADGINLVKTTLKRCFFDAKKCHEGIVCLETYSKRWSSAIGGFTSEPMHNEASHGADAFRYLCAGLRFLNSSSDLTDDTKALRNFFGG